MNKCAASYTLLVQKLCYGKKTPKTNSNSKLGAAVGLTATFQKVNTKRVSGHLHMCDPPVPPLLPHCHQITLQRSPRASESPEKCHVHKTNGVPVTEFKFKETFVTRIAEEKKNKLLIIGVGV